MSGIAPIKRGDLVARFKQTKRGVSCTIYKHGKRISTATLYRTYAEAAAAAMIAIAMLSPAVTDQEVLK